MRKIMIIEDDKNLQDIYKINFEAFGYRVVIEGDGLSGISRVIEEKPDVIILDIMMPNMDGFAFLKAINENTELDIPVVVFSNLSDQATKDKAKELGAADVLLKVDYSGKDLAVKIEDVLLRHKAEKGGAYK